jgi:hypothetical protein
MDSDNYFFTGDETQVFRRWSFAAAPDSSWPTDVAEQLGVVGMRSKLVTSRRRSGWTTTDQGLRFFRGCPNRVLLEEFIGGIWHEVESVWTGVPCNLPAELLLRVGLANRVNTSKSTARVMIQDHLEMFDRKLTVLGTEIGELTHTNDVNMAADSMLDKGHRGYEGPVLALRGWLHVAGRPFCYPYDVGADLDFEEVTRFVPAPDVELGMLDDPTRWMAYVADLRSHPYWSSSSHASSRNAVLRRLCWSSSFWREVQAHRKTNLYLRHDTQDGEQVNRGNSRVIVTLEDPYPGNLAAVHEAELRHVEEQNINLEANYADLESCVARFTARARALEMPDGARDQLEELLADCELTDCEAHDGGA